jgi:hypothetical protein
MATATDEVGRERFPRRLGPRSPGLTRLVVLVAVCVGAAATLVAPVGASSPGSPARVTSRMLVGLDDEPDTLYGNPSQAFRTLKALRTQVLHVNLYWGGNKWAVANHRPKDPTDPGDPAYDWALYDRLVMYAHTYHIEVVFSILGTPAWANGGLPPAHAPTNPHDLASFAHAAAERYSGYWTPPRWQYQPSLGVGGHALPTVKHWTAWNEPNNPIWLTPQYERADGKWVVESAVQYAKICNAVYRGIHSLLISPRKGPVPGERVACGVTAPRGNDNPRSVRPSVDPITFLKASRRAGMSRFDAYAHNPYASAGSQGPSYVPNPRTRRVQLGNLDVLTKLLTRYYGPKSLWITEYGYQTDPPTKTVFSTTWSRQALYLKQAVTLLRKTPRVSMFLWFLVRDEPRSAGWHSGLETAGGTHKPAWAVFRSLPRG